MTTPFTMHLTLTSDPAAIAPTRRAVERFAVDAGLSDRGAADLGLCVNEAIANVIRHAYAGRHDRPVEVSATADALKIEVAVRDWGSGRVPDLSADRDPTDLTPGGLGLPCLKKLLDGLTYEPLPDGMCLRMTKRKS